MSIAVIRDVNMLTLADAVASADPGSIPGMRDAATEYYISGHHLWQSDNYIFTWLMDAVDGPIQDGGVASFVDVLGTSATFAILRSDTPAYPGTAYWVYWDGTAVQVQINASATLTTLGTITLSPNPTGGTSIWMLSRVEGISPATITVSYWAGNFGTVPDFNSPPIATGSFVDSSGSAPSTRGGYMGLSVPGLSHVQRLEIVKDVAAPVVTARPVLRPIVTFPGYAFN
jgi:hypothetical protein